MAEGSARLLNLDDFDLPSEFESRKAWGAGRFGRRLAG
jgi:hypothetical protein